MEKRLREYLNEAGFARIVARGSYENYPTQESLKRSMDMFASVYEERAFIDSVVEAGIANEKQMTEYAGIIREFGKHPDSFLANAHCEAIGWKP